MTTRNKRKLAALNKENCEEHPRSNLAQNSSAPRSQEDYITQVSEEIEGRVTKRLSKEFSRTENRFLGALTRLDDFLMNPLLSGHSGTTPEPTRNALYINQGTNEDDSQNDLHPESGLFHGQTTRNDGPEDGHDSTKKTLGCAARRFSFTTTNHLSEARHEVLDCLNVINTERIETSELNIQFIDQYLNFELYNSTKTSDGRVRKQFCEKYFLD